jgi:ubiquinone/menaquinone biosynthesis C-methylase UbiE
MARAGYWNHNVHYQSVILGAVPPGCGPALDVGCGDGLLAGRLAERCTEVTGIDRDRRMIAVARSQVGDQTRVRFIEADFLVHDFPPASFDFVCANTSLHHMDFPAALTAMARALRPGGHLAVVGLAADGSFGDYLASTSVIPVNLVYRALRGERNSGAPVTAPEMTWAQVRATARRLLPGVRYRRHPLFRYSLLWRKPPEGAAGERRISRFRT